MNKKLLKIITVSTFALGLGVIPCTFAKTPTSFEFGTTSLEIVKNPQKYLNANVKFIAKFDKFTALGLDYKQALRSSENYIAFTIQRDDVKDHNIPLSEMKLMVKREIAEKYAELNTGDKIEIQGKVFSTALGDPWIEVEKISVKEKVKEKK